MSIDTLSCLFIPGILIYSLGFLFVLIKVSGWDQIATMYPYRSTFQGKIFKFSSAYLGTTQFKGSLDIGINHEGLYLRPFILFRLHYPPALIPWSDVSRFEKKKIWWMDFYCLDLGRPKIRTLKLPSRLFSLHPEIVARLERLQGDDWKK
jgi:hypothetical protein